MAQRDQGLTAVVKDLSEPGGAPGIPGYHDGLVDAPGSRGDVAGGGVAAGKRAEHRRELRLTHADPASRLEARLEGRDRSGRVSVHNRQAVEEQDEEQRRRVLQFTRQRERVVDSL